MKTLSYRGYRFPPGIIQHAVWLYLRFTLSFRDVEDLLAERGITVSYETIRRWVAHFGPIYARRLRASRPGPTGRWHLDEVFVPIAGQQMYLWRAVDDEGEVLDVLVQSKRDKDAALRLMRKLLKHQGLVPTSIVTDRYRVYDAALRDLGLSSIPSGQATEQSGGKFARPHPTTRAKDAELSIRRIGTTFPFQPLSQLQHIQRQPSSDHRQHPSDSAQRGLRYLEGGGHCLSLTTHRSAARPWPTNVTSPLQALCRLPKTVWLRLASL